jgi:putative hydrolase of the HAD superfamily
MTYAVAQALGIDIDAADQIRSQYWRRYGATVIGMVRHHGVNARSFLASSHDFDIAPLVRAESLLAHKLKRLPGRKVLITNAPFHYARAVLRRLGILWQFDSLWTIEHMCLHGELRPKPSAALLRYVLAREGVPPARAVLVEDTLINLRSARRVGLRTVHVFHPVAPFACATRFRPAYVDLRVHTVGDLLVGRRRFST